MPEEEHVNAAKKPLSWTDGRTTKYTELLNWRTDGLTSRSSTSTTPPRFTSPVHKFFRAQGRTLVVRSTILISQLALSGSAPLGGAPTLASCGSPLSSGPLITETPAGRPGQPSSRTQRRQARRRAQYQRLKDGPAWQTAREVRRELTEFQKALHQAQGHGFKTMSSLPSARSTRASLTSTKADPCTDSSRGYIQNKINTSRTVPQCSIASDLGVNNPIMGTGICADLREHIEANVHSYSPGTGDKRKSLDVNADNLTVGGANEFAIEREAVFSLESSIHQLCATLRPRL